MKTFVVLINELAGEDINSKLSFMKFIDDNLFEWWKYSSDTYFLATPDNFTSEGLEEKIVQMYPHAISAVIETDFKKWSGYGPMRRYEGKKVPFTYWFSRITDKEFVPAWESESNGTHYNMKDVLKFKTKDNEN